MWIFSSVTVDPFRSLYISMYCCWANIHSRNGSDVLQAPAPKDHTHRSIAWSIGFFAYSTYFTYCKWWTLRRLGNSYKLVHFLYQICGRRLYSDSWTIHIPTLSNIIHILFSQFISLGFSAAPNPPMLTVIPLYSASGSLLEIESQATEGVGWEVQ